MEIWIQNGDGESGSNWVLMMRFPALPRSNELVKFQHISTTKILGNFEKRLDAELAMGRMILMMKDVSWTRKEVV